MKSPLASRTDPQSAVRVTQAGSQPHAAPGEPCVSVRALEKRYGRVVALAGIDLSIAAGETLALLGPNGAGKTTLMQLLAGVSKPDAGSVTIGELGDPRRATVRRALGFAPQALAIYPQLTARENLSFFAQLYGVPREHVAERVRLGLELADLMSRAEQRAATFSGGMQRRLNLACAVVHGPRLLLLDEPTVGVDPHSRNHLLEAIAGLGQTGLTLVYSTHLMDEAERLCDRVAIVDRGRLLALGERSALCEQHGCSDLSTLFLRLTGKELRD
jgi:ABC-2 type transport system ATP-binding protein